MKRTIALLVIIIVIVLIQIYLSKRTNKWAGLVLPLLTLIWSFVYPATNSWRYQSGISLDFVIQLFVIWFTINIYTILLLGIYFLFRNRQK